MTDTINNNKYQNTKIYKIVDISYTGKYIGSTYDTLSSRMTKHRCDYRRFKKGEYHYVSVFDLFDKYGLENCKIELIEHYPCENIDEQRKREGYHIQNEDCINKRVAGRDSKQYYREHIEWATEYNKQYRQANMEVLREKGKEYREKHKEKAQLYNKQYRETHLDTIKEKQKEYYDRNKDILAEKNKEYRDQHKDKLAVQSKKYYQLHIDSIREYKKKYREENRDRLIHEKREFNRLRVICPHCQKEVSKPNFAPHKKSNYCVSFQNKDKSKKK